MIRLANAIMPATLKITMSSFDLAMLQPVHRMNSRMVPQGVSTLIIGCRVSFSIGLLNVQSLIPTGSMRSAAASSSAICSSEKCPSWKPTSTKMTELDCMIFIAIAVGWS